MNISKMPSLVVDGTLMVFSDESSMEEYKTHLNDAEYWRKRCRELERENERLRSAWKDLESHLIEVIEDEEGGYDKLMFVSGVGNALIHMEVLEEKYDLNI